eukprot:6196067-Pleurochrysis_carterae.AAC.2
MQVEVTGDAHDVVISTKKLKHPFVRAAAGEVWTQVSEPIVKGGACAPPAHNFCPAPLSPFAARYRAEKTAIAWRTCSL